VRRQINEIRNFDIRGELERAVDADGSIRQSFSDPLITPAPTEPVTTSEIPAAGETLDLSAPAETPAETDGEASGPPETAAPEGTAPEGTAAEDTAPAAPAEVELEAPPVFDGLAFLPPSVTAASGAPAFIPPRNARPQAARELPH